MAVAPDADADELVTVERTLEAADGGLVSTVTVASLVDAPLAVRLADDLGAWCEATRIRVHPETEPPRWDLDGARFVAELLVTPGDSVAVAYDLHGAEGGDREAADAALVVERTRPVDPDAVEADGTLPRFRDAAAEPGASSEPSEEATDADVRRAFADVSTTDAAEDQPFEESAGQFDLSDPT